MLEFVDLTRRFGGPGGRVVIDRLSLRLEAGEYVAVTGESGVGKSTLLNLLAGLDKPDSGAVRLDGVELGMLDDDALTRWRRDQLGFVFQAFHVLPHLTLAQNVALPLWLQGEQGPASVAAAGSPGATSTLPDVPTGFAVPSAAARSPPASPTLRW